jgi:hypothetical protein
MPHKKFLEKVIAKIKNDDFVIGLAVAGSWISGEIDEYSDLDLILITSQKVAPDNNKMMEYAGKFGDLLNAFTGEHVGENRLLICLYKNPLLHVDIKFLTTDEYSKRIENPVIVWERDKILSTIQKFTEPKFPFPNYQWIEDRFWIWIHYTCLKIGRGELFEALDCISFLRVTVISPLLLIKNNQLPRGIRKVEQKLKPEDLEALKGTVTTYNRLSIIESLKQNIKIYQELQKELYSPNIILRNETRQSVLEYFKSIVEIETGIF